MSFVRNMFWVGAIALLSGLISLTAIDTAKAAPSGCLPGVLKQRLAQIRAKFGRISIISTHRRGARIAGSGRRSFHASCRAVDFSPPRGKYGAVVRWLKSVHGGGVGTYSCGMHHVHIDNGPRIRYHHCVSASGRPVRYAGRRSRAKRSYASRNRGRRTYAKARYQRRAIPVARNRTSRGTRVVAASSSFNSNAYHRQLTRNGG